jgi:hypothetical protein
MYMPLYGMEVASNKIMVCRLRKCTLFLEVGLGFLGAGGGINSLEASSVAVVSFCI